jgi:fructose-bisphosphate aldolase, class II
VPLVTTGELVGAARHGVAAFNVITIEHAEAIVAGAEDAGRAVILQVSENAVRFHGRLEPISAACVAVARSAAVPVSLHLDHVTDAALLRQAPAAGYSSAMFDASTLDYDGNVAATRSAAGWAHANGLWLEAELGEVGGKDGAQPPDAHAPGARTDPDEARAYALATGIDALAVAVGSEHAMTSQTASLDLDLVARLRDAVPVPLVLHGSSGVPEPVLRQAIDAGMVKINIGTALNVAYTGAVRSHVDASVDPRKYLAIARTEMAATVRRLLLAITPPEAGPDSG